MADKIMVGNEVLWDGAPYNEHLASKANPHETTKEQTGAAAALASHNTADTAHGDIRSILNEKVDKVVGKGLSDENYTLDEKSKVANVPENTVAQLAEKVQNFKIKNEVVNGDFSQGIAGYMQILPVNIFEISQNKFKSTPQSLRCVKTGVQRGRFDKTIPNIISGSKVYIKVSAYLIQLISNNINYRLSINMATTNIVGTFNASKINQWQDLSIAGTLTSDANRITIVDDNDNTWESYFDDFIVINMTNVFGTGNEPTKLEMDELMKVIPNGWWDGELSLTQKQFITWQLNLIRKNTNAIIALGGTIV